MPNPSSRYWHIVVRTGLKPEQDRSPYEDQLQRFIDDTNATPCSVPPSKILIQTDVGKADGHFHWHIHLELVTIRSQNSLRPYLQKFFDQPRQLRTSAVISKYKSCVYTLKGQLPVYSYNFTPDEIKNFTDAWTPPKEFKKDSMSSTIKLLRERAEREHINLRSSQQVIRLVLDLYAEKAKAWTDFQIISVVNALQSTDEDFRQEQVDRILQKLSK